MREKVVKKLLQSGCTHIISLLIFYFILVPLFQLLHIFSLEKREEWVASEKHRYSMLASSNGNFGKNTHQFQTTRWRTQVKICFTN